MTPDVPSPWRLSFARPLRLAAFSLAHAWWFVVAPGLLAAVALELLRPGLAVSSHGRATEWMSASLVGAALFIMYAALAHYWRYHLPGGRILSNLPLSVASRCRDADDLRRFASAQALLAALSGRATRRRWARALSPDAQAELASRLSNVRAAIDRHSDPSLQNEVAGLRALTAPLLRMRQFRETVGSVVAIVLVITLALGLRAFAFETFAVASASMLPTLEPGDVILGRRLGDHALSGRNWAPRRGDVVVFSTKAIDAAWPEGTPDHLVKRVIGLPGDRIEVRLDSAIINGWTVPSCDVGTYTYVVPGGDGTFIRGRMKVEFLEGRSYLSLRPPSAVPFEEYVVQPGEFFVLGDNRHNSYDSRAWHGGVPLATIEAQVQRFLRGTHRDGSADFTRLMRSIDASGVHMEGLDQGALREQLARCLRERPKDVPPGPASPPDGKRAPALAPLGPY